MLRTLASRLEGATAVRVFVRGCASATPSRVLEVLDTAQYDREVSEAAEKEQLTVVDYTASWCGPCRMIAPILDTFSTTLSHVRFLKLDIDNAKLQSLVAQKQITGVPTIEFIREKRVVQRITGADKELLERHLYDLS